MEQFELAITQDEQSREQPQSAFWDKIANFAGSIAATAPLSGIAIVMNVNNSDALEQIGTNGLKAALVGGLVCGAAIIRGNSTAQ